MNLTPELRKLYLLIFFIAACKFLSAQPGKPDSSFVNNGIFSPTIGEKMALQSDGKFICARYRLARYNNDGTFDSSFAINGVASLDSGTIDYISPRFIIIHADNKISLIGTINSGSRYAMVRFLPNGNRDSSLNGNGKSILDSSITINAIFSATLQNDNKIILAGGTNTFFLARLNTDGSFDNSFGLNGIVKTAFNGNAIAYSVAVQSDRKIIALGLSHIHNPNGRLYGDSMAVARYRPDGSLDKDFNGNGKFAINPLNPAVGTDRGAMAESLCLQPDGKIIIGGSSMFTQSHGRWLYYDFAIIRLHPNGVVDSTFNGDGIKVIKSNVLRISTRGIKISLQSDGKIIIAGNSGGVDFMDNHVAMARVTSSGNMDNNFGFGGAVIFQDPKDPYTSSRSSFSGMELNNHRIYISSQNIGSIPSIFAFQNDGIPMSPSSQTQCPLTSTIIFKSDLHGNSHQWQLSTDSVVFTNITNNTNYSGTNDSVLNLTNIPSAWYGYRYRCIVDNGISNLFTIKFSNEWTGAVSNAWEDPANWLCEAVPDINTDVIINSGTVLLNSNTTIRSLMIKPGVSFDIAAGYHLTLTH